jgi:hypothetical protein
MAQPQAQSSPSYFQPQSGALPDEHGRKPLCPGARPDSEGAVIFGVLYSPAGGDAGRGAPTVGYLQRAARPTLPILALASPAAPAAVFRFGGRCAEAACQHFDGARCALAERLVPMLPAVADQPPPCAVRSACRWFQEQGPALCRRCPQIVQPAFAPAGVALVGIET